MDPFVVASFGKKVFRTRVIRHSRNPIWDEKLLFHVRRYETLFRIQLTILDWDKLSSNDYIGGASIAVADLMSGAPQPDPATGLYQRDVAKDAPQDGTSGEGMQQFKLPLTTESGRAMPWESKHSPHITVRARYQPYDALRQQFWRQYLKQYDTDDTGSLSHVEITSMLDSLGSTLTRSTVNGFFERFGKKPHEDELRLEEVIQCLETELGRPDSEKKRVDVEDPADSSTSVLATPVLMVADGVGRPLELDQMDFSGPPMAGNALGGAGEEKPRYPTQGAQQRVSFREDDSTGSTPGEEYGDPIGIGRSVGYSSSDAEDETTSSGSAATPPAGDTDDAATIAPGAVAGTKKKSKFRRNKKAKPSDLSAAALTTPSPAEDPFERVINIRNCPLCHRPRLNDKAEMDIVTHLAVCASQDWARVDRIVVGNFVTASQAQRKWYTKIIGKVSSGDYKLGANSANIIVQNRITGQLEEEKMQVYVRLGIRLLYKGAKSRMEGGRARRLLKSLSIKQGIKYDSPESARDIPTFIQFHQLKVEEILDPLDSFSKFLMFMRRNMLICIGTFRDVQ